MKKHITAKIKDEHPAKHAPGLSREEFKHAQELLHKNQIPLKEEKHNIVVSKFSRRTRNVSLPEEQKTQTVATTNETVLNETP